MYIEACLCSVVFYIRPNLMQLHGLCKNTLVICCCWDADYRTVPCDFDVNKQIFQLAQQTLCVRLICSVLCCCMLWDVITIKLQNHWKPIHCNLVVLEPYSKATKTFQDLLIDSSYSTCRGRLLELEDSIPSAISSLLCEFSLVVIYVYRYR